MCTWRKVHDIKRPETLEDSRYIAEDKPGNS